MITPDFAPHKTLEDEVKNYLESKDYLIYEATYHAIASPETRNILSRRFTPTALYLRGRADRIAIHKQQSVEFEFECKTHNPKDQKYKDATIEMLPLIHHISKVALDVKCLYTYRHIKEDEKIGINILITECGFWVEQLPPIRVIMIPTRRWTDEGIAWFESLAQTWFPNVDIAKPLYGSGTDDPYIIIDHSELQKLPHWQSLIEFEETKSTT